MLNNDGLVLQFLLALGNSSNLLNLGRFPCVQILAQKFSLTEKNRRFGSRDIKLTLYFVEIDAWLLFHSVDRLDIIQSINLLSFI